MLFDEKRPRYLSRSRARIHPSRIKVFNESHLPDQTIIP